jgi:hypothetical protein
VKTNNLSNGDNLDILRRHVPDGSVAAAEQQALFG